MNASTECVKTRNERPWKINATTVIAMPTENIFTDLNEPKFSLLIMHKSSNALLTELIPRSVFRFEINFFANFKENEGNWIFFFAEYIKIKNQNPNVGAATATINRPINMEPLVIATNPAIKGKMVPTNTSAIISIVVTHAARAGTPLLVKKQFELVRLLYKRE